jgi:hypothetical protein
MQLQASFSAEEIHTLALMAPTGNIIFSAGDPTFVMKDLPPIIDTNVVPKLLHNVEAPKGVRFVAANAR